LAFLGEFRYRKAKKVGGIGGLGLGDAALGPYNLSVAEFADKCRIGGGADHR